MINKILANLPFNPSLIGQVSFYAKRLRKEESIRRTGLIFVVLAMLVQIFAVISPPEKSLASSDTNIINGVKTKSDLLKAWDNKNSDVSKIYSFFGVSRDDIAALSTKPNTKIRSNAADYWSIGRSSLSGFSNVDQKYKKAEITYHITDTTTVYMRQLKAWDIKNPYNTYVAWQGKKKSNGETFWIVVECGNLVVEKKQIVEKKPELEMRKTILSKVSSLKPGERFSYRIEYRNKIAGSLPANNVVIQDELDLAHFEVVSTSPSNIPITGNILNYKVASLSYTPTFNVIDINVRLKTNLNNGTKICNVSKMTASNASSVTGGGSPGACLTVDYCPLNPALPANSPECRVSNAAAVCTLTDAKIEMPKREVSFLTKVSTTDAKLTEILSYDYDFGDGVKTTQKSSSLDNTIKHIYPAGSYHAQVIVNYKVKGSPESSKAAACAANIDIQPDLPISRLKSVKIIDSGVEGEAALKTKVKAGNTIEYKLVTSNTQSFDRQYDIEDYIGDLLDYADLDLNHLSQQGGKFNAAAKKVSWTNQTLKAREDTVKTFRIKMKSPIPSTNSPTNLSTTFDCKISNEYGNETSLEVDCAVIKKVEELPNTGPGTTLAIAFTVTVLAAYFFARSRLLAKELTIVRHEQAAIGGI